MLNKIVDLIKFYERQRAHNAPLLLSYLILFLSVTLFCCLLLYIWDTLIVLVSNIKTLVKIL